MKEPFSRSILIPTDFSRVCENAIHHGYELAKGLGYSITFLHVAPPEGKEGPTTPGWSDPATRNFRDLYVMNDPVKTGLVIRYGNLFKEINRMAEKVRPNLMILGTHGKQGMQKLYGSYALRVVLDAPCAVIVVHTQPFNLGYRKILVPVHGEIDPAQTAVWLIRMHTLYQSHVSLLRMTETDEDLNKRFREVLSGIIQKLAAAKVPFEISASDLHEDFSTQVLKFAGMIKADLIMTIPGSGDHRFSFSAWNERLMFNDDLIPVMILNQMDSTEEWCRWMEREPDQ
jgi:nucleotide-binding universal stress UspA family protein